MSAWIFWPRLRRWHCEGETEWLVAFPPFSVTVYTSKRGLRETSCHAWFGSLGCHAFITKGHLPHRISFEHAPAPTRKDSPA